MKSNLRVWNNLIGRTEPHVLVIALLINFSAIGAEAINEPRLIEGFSITAGQRIFELSNGSLQSRESRPENLVNGVAAVGPVGGDRIEPAEYAKDSGTEFYGRDAKGNESLNRERAKDANKHNNHGDGPGWDDYFHAVILGLAALIPMFPVFMRKHNY